MLNLIKKEVITIHTRFLRHQVSMSHSNIPHPTHQRIAKRIGRKRILELQNIFTNGPGSIEFVVMYPNITNATPELPGSPKGWA